ncbi:hypothetical protein GUITHDRAFT_106843 [Guillardia theta CCMP2712]|uniref:Uncharacterized protein n=1 Tax=Guillardia theta (strain CCMP2712) TaxID=905079 RepID=L1JFV8_GUITC|nr:hypothetical protein GUITHDRAFT_106843 [Guillardia theta CCMP2712]EKX47398.1 hypothetical protein GUITHDRAFT_106843 [Guillardia theta CCMP2712]|eukprot:XP_005834378.1 hypothetical protein GUITHDRAFT_106843 [Guillardia theta CCMP2712]
MLEESAKKQLTMGSKGDKMLGLKSMFSKVENNPNVKMVKGQYKALEAIDDLGSVSNKRLFLHKAHSKKRNVLHAIADVAKKAGVKISVGKISATEKEKAANMVEELLKSASKQIKMKAASPREVFKSKMKKAMFNYKLYKGQHRPGVHDTKPIQQSLPEKNPSWKSKLEYRNPNFHDKMAKALLYYQAYRTGGGSRTKPMKPDIPTAADEASKPEYVMNDSVSSMHRRHGSVQSSHANHRYKCDLTGCHVIEATEEFRPNGLYIGLKEELAQMSKSHVHTSSRVAGMSPTLSRPSDHAAALRRLQKKSQQYNDAMPLNPLNGIPGYTPRHRSKETEAEAPVTSLLNRMPVPDSPKKLLETKAYMQQLSQGQGHDSAPAFDDAAPKMFR